MLRQRWQFQDWEILWMGWQIWVRQDVAVSRTMAFHLVPDTCSVLTDPGSFLDDLLETETASILLGRGGPITHHDCLRDSPSPSLEQPSELSETNSWTAFARLLASFLASFLLVLMQVTHMSCQEEFS